MKISKELLNYVADGDLHTMLDGVEHSTNLREIVTIGYMVEEYGQSIECLEIEKAAS